MYCVCMSGFIKIKPKELKKNYLVRVQIYIFNRILLDRM